MQYTQAAHYQGIFGRCDMDGSLPILEYDPTTEVIIEPRRLFKPLVGMPEHGVICFFQDVIDHFVAEGRLTLLKNLRSEMGEHPIYAFNYWSSYPQRR